MREALNRNITTWVAYDDREILVKDIEVRHLVNILNHIKQSNEEAGRAVYPADVYALMIAEAELRIMVGFADNKGIPKRLEDGTYTLINQTDAEKAVEDAKSLMHKQLMKRKMRQNQKKKEEKDRPFELNHI